MYKDRPLKPEEMEILLIAAGKMTEFEAVIDSETRSSLEENERLKTQHRDARLSLA